MKTISLLALMGQTAAAPSGATHVDRFTALKSMFDWNPFDATCGTSSRPSSVEALETSVWAAFEGKHDFSNEAGNVMPTYRDEEGVQYCSFDGLNDYLALTMSFEGEADEPRSAFTIKSKFRTSSDKSHNWSLLDCDRSEYFNLSLNAQGKIIFSTSGRKPEGKAHDPDDMHSLQSGLNDGEWHTVTAVFNEGQKSLFIDSWLDASSMQDQSSTLYPIIGSEGVKEDGTWKGMQKRSCFIGDGSEAKEFDGGRNNRHFEGDISRVQFFAGKVVIPDNPSFAYYPRVNVDADGLRTGSCVSDTDYGWPVRVGVHTTNEKAVAPTFGGDGSLNYCQFDGVSDYLAIDKRYFNKEIKDFQIRIVFNTDVTEESWYMFDCDRSEFFHVKINNNGKIAFATSGANENGEAVKTHDMHSVRKGLNDGNWHEVIVKFIPSLDGTNGALKQIFIDGVEDVHKDGRLNRAHDCDSDGLCRNAVGAEKKRRYCYIGAGSESDRFDQAGGRNKNGHFAGKIAVIDYVENGAELPGTSPLDCFAEKCLSWTCDMWCKCYDEQWDDLYAKSGCADDGEQECDCGWGRNGGFLNVN